MKRKIIMDCDPGIDDAVALMLAGAHRDQWELLAVTTVAGNQTIERVTENALKLTVFLGMEEVPVVRGAARPLIRPVIPAEAVHGSTGLGECRIPDTAKKIASEKQAAAYMAEQILALPEGEKVTLVPTGPLTNIALLLRVFPEVKERIEEICLMGGGAAGGNVTPSGEFNIWQDPEAAQIVFQAGIPIIMCGLDVTNHCGFGRPQVDEMLQSENPVVHAMGEMVDFYFHCPVYAGKNIAAIHDAVTFTYLLHPEWFEGRKLNVEIDCSDGPGRGRTICDFRGNSSGDQDVTVLLKADTEKILQFWMETLDFYKK